MLRPCLQVHRTWNSFPERLEVNDEHLSSDVFTFQFLTWNESTPWFPSLPVTKDPFGTLLDVFWEKLLWTNLCSCLFSLQSTCSQSLKYHLLGWLFFCFFKFVHSLNIYNEPYRWRYCLDHFLSDRLNCCAFLRPQNSTGGQRNRNVD